MHCHAVGGVYMKKWISLFLTLILAACFSSVLAETDVYDVGDKVENFTITTYDGKTYSLYESLENHELVLLNFWASWCSPCMHEVPFMQEAYEQMEGRVEIFSVNIEASDTDEDIKAIAEEHSITFPLARDTIGLKNIFPSDYIPMMILIDGNATIVYIDSGARSSTEEFIHFFETYLGRKPDVAAESEATLAAQLNAEGGDIRFFNSEDEYAWPMVAAEVDGRSVVVSSNGNKPVSYASVKAEVTADIGDALVIEFKTSSEPVLDLMKICVNNEVVKVFGGMHDWMTYAHPFTKSGVQEIEINYVKGENINYGEDCIWIDTVKVVDASEALSILNENPAYPTHDEVSLELVAPNAKKVLIFDPYNLMDSMFGDHEAYILFDDQAEFVFGITNEFDPELTFLYTDYDMGIEMVTSLQSDENGFYHVYTGCDSADTTGYSYSTAYLYADPALDPETAIVYFMDEANLDMWINRLTIDPANPPVWTYEEDLENGEDVIAVEEAAYDYVVTVADQNGAPVSGVMLQVCDDSLCSVYVTDENGQSAFSVLPGAWEMHILMLPEGYEGKTDEIIPLAAGGEELEIVVNKK